VERRYFNNWFMSVSTPVLETSYSPFNGQPQTVIEPRGVTRNRPSDGSLLRADTEQQQCLVVLLHAVPFDFAHDRIP
jgi:hypothetical protein